MGCTHTVQCLISEDIMQDSEELLKNGEFSSFAELANHAIRCFAEAIQFGFTTGPYVRMKGTQPKNVRVEKYPMDVLKERCGLKSYEFCACYDGLMCSVTSDGFLKFPRMDRRIVNDL